MLKFVPDAPDFILQVFSALIPVLSDSDLTLLSGMARLLFLSMKQDANRWTLRQHFVPRQRCCRDHPQKLRYCRVTLRVPPALAKMTFP
jgi:hypothetical protein